MVVAGAGRYSPERTRIGPGSAAASLLAVIWGAKWAGGLADRHAATGVALVDKGWDAKMLRSSNCSVRRHGMGCAFGADMARRVIEAMLNASIRSQLRATTPLLQGTWSSSLKMTS